jgi:D-alanyl-D-alanine carboxypeptidase
MSSGMPGAGRGVLCAGVLALLAACGNSGAKPPHADTEPTTGASVTPAAHLGPFTGRLLSSDLLVTSDSTLPASLVSAIKHVKGVAGVNQLSLGQLSVEGRTLTVAAVDPATYRRFTPTTTAHADSVWDRVAGGEVAVAPEVAKGVVGAGDMLALGGGSSDKVHVGAYAPLSPSFSVVADEDRGKELGLPNGNALLVSTGSYTPSALAEPLRKAIHGRASLKVLALEFDVDAVQTAVLTGSSVAQTVGSFSYVAHPNGTITPDPKFVSTYIRTEAVPILGNVTCNVAMFPQLRAALGEIVQRGLADEIHPSEYGGCYYPRFIGRDPRNGLSLHSWGIAIDLNVPGNQRGTAGHMDPAVVQIFKKWGYAWGGDWNYTDPMHFEINRIVTVH